MNQYDVIVAGGGTAGAIAAIAAARGGARTLIIELKSYLGGSATYGIPFLGLEAGNGTVLHSKLVSELIDRLRDGGFSPGLVTGSTWNSGQNADNYQFSLVPFDPEGLKYVLQEMACEAGVDILYNTMLTGTQFEGRRITAVEVHNKSGRSVIGASVFLDCTGDADLIHLSGGAFLEKKSFQNSSILFHIGGVDLAAFYEEYQKGTFIKGKGSWHTRVLFAPKKPGGEATLVHLAAHFHLGCAPEDQITFTAVSNRDGELYLNATRTAGVDGTCAEQVSRAEISERRNVMRIMRALQENVHGFEHSVLLNTSPLGIRESRNIKGDYVITREDVLNGTKFPDGVAFGSYPIDIHDPNGGRTQFQFIQHGDYYSIPYRAMLPENLDGVLVAGRCISADHNAVGTVRIMGCVLAQGAAAGTAAAMCIQKGVMPRQLPAAELQQQLFTPLEVANEKP